MVGKKNVKRIFISCVVLVFLFLNTFLQCSNAGSSGSTNIEIGTICLWARSPDLLPAGWYVCNASNHNFNSFIPDLQSYFVVGVNKLYKEYNMIGKTGGEESVSLSLSQMPAHDHAFPMTFLVSITTTLGNYGSIIGSTSVIRTISTSSNTAVRSQGSGIAHENRPPFYVVYYVIYLGA